MSGVAGLGAVVAGILAPKGRWMVQRPWATISVAGTALGVALIALGAAVTFPFALVALVAIGAAGLVFQTTTQSLMLTLSDIEYHGRMQSMVVLGFSGFGLAALPLGLLADAVTLEVTLALMGGVVLIVTACSRPSGKHRRSWSASSWRDGVAARPDRAGGRTGGLRRSSRRRGTWPPTAP